MGVHYYKGDHIDLGISKEQMMKDFLKIFLQIREVMPYTMNANVLKRVLKRTDPKPFIMLRTPKDMGHRAASYLPETNEIELAWDPTLSDAMLVKLLSNEMNHMTVCDKQRDRSLQGCMLFPRPKPMNNIINNGYEKINKYDVMYNNYLADGGQIPRKIKKLIEAAASYIPREYDWPAFIKSYTSLLNQPQVTWLKDGHLFIPKDTYVDGGVYRGYFPADTYATVGKEKNGEMPCKTSFARDLSSRERARAFLSDMKERERTYEPGCPYSTNAEPEDIFTQSLGGQIAEKMSDLDELPKELLELFFSGYCDEMSKFQNVSDYCGRPELRAL